MMWNYEDKCRQGFNLRRRREKKGFKRGGSSFHNLGATTEKVHHPWFLGWQDAADQWTSKTLRGYKHVRRGQPSNILKINNKILKLILKWTGSQWREGWMWAVCSCVLFSVKGEQLCFGLAVRGQGGPGSWMPAEGTLQESSRLGWNHEPELSFTFVIYQSILNHIVWLWSALQFVWNF